MNKLVPLCFLLLLISSGFKPEQTGEFMDWQADRLLKWSDFKAQAPRNTSHAALTNSGISMDMAFRNGSYAIKILAQFDKSKSWHKKDSKSDYLLGHEQTHFDITELYARKLRKRILTTRWKNAADFDSRLNPIYAENQAALAAFQDTYDKETDHSLIKDKEEMWQLMIADSLKAYEKFKGQNLSLAL